MASQSSPPRSVHDFTVNFVFEGLEILAFPCNQFGSQEPGTDEEIQEFACTRLKAEYPIFDKLDVNGANAALIYKFLKSSKGSLLGMVSNGTSQNFLSIKRVMLWIVTYPPPLLSAWR